jgi:hypothetical protein
LQGFPIMSSHLAKNMSADGQLFLLLRNCVYLHIFIIHLLD